jgi:hypothetical protein
MRTRFVVPTLLAALLAAAAPLFAFDRGEVLLENRTQQAKQTVTDTFDLWQYSGGSYAVAIGSPLIEKPVPYTGAGHFLIPQANQIIFHNNQTVSVWDGVILRFTDTAKGYTDIFHDTTELTEFAPMRSGNFLVAERWNDLTHGASLIEFNFKGMVRSYRFPDVIDSAHKRALGARHIELLADNCTLLYTLGDDDANGNRVRRMNLCTGLPQTDFATLPAGQYAGSIRQLQNGNVLVADGSAVLQFSSEGSLLRSYQLPGVTSLALSDDGRTFWAAAVDHEQATLMHFNPAVADGAAVSVSLGNPGSQSSVVPLEVSDLVVVDEWRASAIPANGRVRAARH